MTERPALIDRFVRSPWLDRLTLVAIAVTVGLLVVAACRGSLL